MYKNLILKYINLLEPIHIYQYAKENNVELSGKEVSIIYNFIMNNYKELLENEKVLDNLEPYLNPSLFNKIKILYKENKTKYLT